MKAYTISRYSKSDNLQLVDLPMPEPKEQEVLIEIHAASVNVLDAKIKSGEFKLFLPYKFPVISRSRYSWNSSQSWSESTKI
jgi:NADPH:quinone reductase-like Zn-dependent oxidoreductase